MKNLSLWHNYIAHDCIPEVTMMTETNILGWMSATLLVSVAVNEFHITETPSKSHIINVRYSIKIL
jgi:hypothetical protein